MTAWLIQSLFWSTILLVVVLLLRPWTLRRFGPRMAYGLWLLPLCRLVLPVGEIGAIRPPVTALGGDLAALTTTIGSETSALVHSPQADLIGTALIILWAIGAIIHLGWGLFAYSGFMRRAAAAVVGAGADLDGITVQTSAFVTGPVAAGLWRRRIFLPLDFGVRYDADQQTLVLAHEGAHHRRRDIGWNFVALALVSVHWFNPLAHYACRLYRADQELACDADVVAAFPTSRRIYGALLARETRIGGGSPVCALGRAALIKQRVVALARPAGVSGGQAMALLAPVAIAGLVLTTPVSIDRIDAAASSLPETAAAVLVVPPDAVSGAARGSRPALPTHVRRPRPTPSTEPVAPAPIKAVELTAAAAVTPEDRALTDHLARRREAGLIRSRSRMQDPAQAARDRGRPIPPPSPPGT